MDIIFIIFWCCISYIAGGQVQKSIQKKKLRKQTYEICIDKKGMLLLRHNGVVKTLIEPGLLTELPIIWSYRWSTEYKS